MRSFTVKSTTESGLLVAITVIMALIAVAGAIRYWNFSFYFRPAG